MKGESIINYQFDIFILNDRNSLNYAIIEMIRHIIIFLMGVVLFSSCVKTSDMNKTEDNAVESVIEESNTNTAEVVPNLSNDEKISIEYNVLTDDEEISGSDKKVLYQDVRYPEIKLSEEFKNGEIGSKLSKSIDLLNKKFNNEAIDFLNENQEDVRQVFKERGDDGGNYQYLNELYIERFDDKILSITSNCYEDRMGAHGSTVITGYNFDLETGKEIKFDKLIKDKQKLKELLVDYLNENHKDELMEYYEDTIDAYMNGESEISYTVTVEGINVVFQQYDIAPYAVGIITVPINYEKNKELFNTNYWI